MYREGVVRALQDSGAVEVVGEASDGRTALEEIRRLAPDVALLDLRMPGLDGISVTKALGADGLATRVVLLSAQDDGELILEGVAAGASAYIAKDADRDEICETLIRVAEGEHVVGSELQEQLLKAIQQQEGSVLSPRERQILSLVAEGNTTPQIGKALHVSPATVKTHLQHIFEKLDVSDRAAAVAEAMRRGLLS